MIFRFFGPLLLLHWLCVTLALSGCAVADDATDTPADIGLSRYAMEHDGIEREYLVFRPPGTEGRPLPLLVALHGYGTTASGFAATYGLNSHAAAHGYTIVYPQGSQFMGRFGEDPDASAVLVTSWNDLASNFTPAPGAGPHCTEDRYRYPCPPECGSCNHCAWTSCYDDLGFLKRVLEQASARYATDNGRIYLLGNSNGAMMAMRWGCDAPGSFAAVVALIAQMPPGFECTPGKTGLPLLHLAGARDDTVGHDGTATSSGWIFASRDATQAVWAEGMACRGNPLSWRTPLSEAQGLQCKAMVDCPVAGDEVVACLDPEAGHEWRGQRADDVPANCVYPLQAASFSNQPLCGAYTRGKKPWGMDLAWEFLSRYRRQR